MLISPTRMEPARLEDPSSEIIEKARRLRVQSALLAQAAAPELAPALRNIVAAVDSAWSHKIENERVNAREALRELESGSISTSAGACAMVHVEISAHGAQGADPAFPDYLRGLHQRMFPDAGARSWAGRWRDVDVSVGQHVPPPHECLDAFLEHYNKRFRTDWLHGDATRLLAAVTAHHRLSWIHPFRDGNGRLVRMSTHAMLGKAGVEGQGLWSISRALARAGTEPHPVSASYHEMIAFADRPRQGDRDGRGNLSLAALERYTRWFLDVCLSEVEFMSELLSSGKAGLTLPEAQPLPRAGDMSAVAKQGGHRPEAHGGVTATDTRSLMEWPEAADVAMRQSPESQGPCLSALQDDLVQILQPQA